VLQLNADELTAATTTKILRMKGSVWQLACRARRRARPRRCAARAQADITVTFSGKEASDARDALAKFVYEKLFDWWAGRRTAAALGR
jgi:hypothetical protein